MPKFATFTYFILMSVGFKSNYRRKLFEKHIIQHQAYWLEYAHARFTIFTCEYNFYSNSVSSVFLDLRKNDFFHHFLNKISDENKYSRVLRQMIAWLLRMCTLLYFNAQCKQRARVQSRKRVRYRIAIARVIVHLKTHIVNYVTKINKHLTMKSFAYFWRLLAWFMFSYFITLHSTQVNVAIEK